MKAKQGTPLRVITWNINSKTKDELWDLLLNINLDIADVMGIRSIK